MTAGIDPAMPGGGQSRVPAPRSGRAPTGAVPLPRGPAAAGGSHPSRRISVLIACPEPRGLGGNRRYGARPGAQVWAVGRR